MHYTDQQDFSIKLSYSMSRLLFVFSFSLREKKRNSKYMVLPCSTSDAKEKKKPVQGFDI